MEGRQLPPIPGEDTHRPQMDGLRFIAFLGVFVYHEWLDWPEAAFGRLGVPLFFALSGFLITRILVLHATNSLWHDLRVFTRAGRCASSRSIMPC
jgi:peptidoglycan/LPS O-acetylase OafA/YrhL